MSERVTDFRVDRVSIAEADYWALPSETRRLIETYASGGMMRVDRGSLTFEMPIYRWQEIQASLRHLDAGATYDAGATHE